MIRPSVRRAHRNTPGAHRCHVPGRIHRPTQQLTKPFAKQSGFTLVEMLIAVGLAAILLAGLNGVIGLGLASYDATTGKNTLTQQARFAMDQMVHQVSHSRQLLLPLVDNPGTITLIENIREQTSPASAPPAGSLLGTAVLAVTLPAYFDLDGDDLPDADNDGDGRIDEDLGGDASNDGLPGIAGIDDNGDGTTDISSAVAPNKDDDEDNDRGEDNLDGIDNDGDGAVDEDMKDDANNDGMAGILGVDDDSDGTIDEGAVADDDEDGSSDEDWIDPLVFYLVGSSLMQRTPVPWDVNSSGTVTGADFIEQAIAENVSRLRIERVPQLGRDQLVDITLELTSPDNSVSLNTRVRVGGAL